MKALWVLYLIFYVLVTTYGMFIDSDGTDVFLGIFQLFAGVAIFSHAFKVDMGGGKIWMLYLVFYVCLVLYPFIMLIAEDFELLLAIALQAGFLIGTMIPAIYAIYRCAKPKSDRTANPV